MSDLYPSNVQCLNNVLYLEQYLASHHYVPAIQTRDQSTNTLPLALHSHTANTQDMNQMVKV